MRLPSPAQTSKERQGNMVKIDDSQPKRKISSFVFWDKARISIMIISLICLTVAQMNSLTFNFTVICMDDLIEEYHTNINNTGYHWIEVGTTERSLLFSGAAVGAMIGLIPSVPLITSLGVKNMLTISGIISALGSFLFPIATSFHFYAVLLCRILQGLGISILFTVVGVIPGVWAPNNEMGTFLAVLSCAFQFSNILCMPISGFLCESAFGWRSIYYLFGIVTFLVYIVFYIFYTDDPRLHRNVSEKELGRIERGKAKVERESVPYKEICMDRTVNVAYLSVGGGNTGFFILVLFGPSYLRDVLHFDVQSTGVMSAIPFLLSAIVKFTAGKISDKLQFISQKARFTFCAVVSQSGVAAGFYVMAFTSNRTVAQIAYTLAIIFSGLNIMGTIQCVQLRCRQHVHFPIAVISFAAYIIQFVAPIIVGIICPDNLPEQWTRVFLIVGTLVILLNLPFPFFSSAEPGEYVKPKADRKISQI